MTRTTPEPTPSLSASTPDAPFTGSDLIWPVLRLIAGLVVILLVVGTLAHWARPQCEAVARGFVSSYGYWGMALGTFLADGFHFPIPPQFYMLLAIASQASVPASLVVIVAASLLAGVVGYTAARFVANNVWVAARTERSRRLLERAVVRFGARAALIASLLPIPYSILCYLAGLNRMPLRFLVLVCLCRIPKLIAFYLLVYWGWQQA
jgi:membrane protein YqaA with SNARE-associated domain